MDGKDYQEMLWCEGKAVGHVTEGMCKGVGCEMVLMHDKLTITLDCLSATE